MKLVKARVRNFRSAEDSGTFDVGDLTCLVGKNEAGKTAILTALFGSSASANQFSYDTVRDYPRASSLATTSGTMANLRRLPPSLGSSATKIGQQSLPS